MNRSIFNATLVALLSGLTFPHAHGAEGITEALLACADEPDDARRLRCFDATVAELRGERAAPAAGAVAAAAATPDTSAPTAPPQPSTPAASAEDRFGARGELKREKTGDVSELTATAMAVSAKPHGELVITLDNGQVWTEIAPGSKIRVKAGDAVKIEAGTLGSFILIAPNGRSSKVSRVR
jgi:hypothetical protein